MKTTYNNITRLCFSIVSCALLNACNKKDDFLNVKPDQSLIIASSLNDVKSILLNENLFNVNDPAMGTISDGDLYVTSDVWTNSIISNTERNTYIWARDIYQGSNEVNQDWNVMYQQIYSTNTVLEGLAKINTVNQNAYNEVKGIALFFRSAAFYNIVQTFALPYDPATASSDPGIPLKLTTNLTEPVKRASVKDCYDQIISDLQTAAGSLPDNASERTTPNKTAANAMLSRIYLAIGDYTNAMKYATAALSVNNTLIDFNTLTPGSSSLSSDFLPEDILHLTMRNTDVLNRRKGIVDSTLYRLYTTNDLRKTAYFIVVTGAIRFRGSYDQYGSKFSGLATDELYLNRAECYARAGNTQQALNDLNNLLIKRWKTGTLVGSFSILIPMLITLHR
ncbi:RagB/SusD family nutrient uptake outer membrane protein [Mucilaginibacter flavidus]|uniref:RagB/SusD family nutrient uptake outer membrane protein n=1 Tax=Mucilaginibacter flavidus TaxID=2949309 RepID=UPI0020925BF4|nr:RagB/SusD family nutrient uptake outer membrane protein [Mucilaginibacter flavidus]MCO5946729.1 RagB/SusD family nutrient uptake outer membrane protein [Mucilaginibacter flavidus]